MADGEKIKNWFALFVLILILVLAFFVISQIILTIIFALLFAYIFYPLYRKIYHKIKRRNTSAFLLIVILLFLFIAPLILVTPLLVEQTFEVYKAVRGFDIYTFISNNFSKELADGFASHIETLLSKFLTAILGQFTKLLVDLPVLFLKLVVFLFVFFYAVRDGDKLKKYIVELSPFSDSTDRKFIEEFKKITNSVIYGQIFVGIVQGVLVGIGLFIIGFQNVLVLTVIASIVSIIPVLGAWMVWLPIAIILLVSKSYAAAIFLLIYGALFVSLIDNFLRPYIMLRQANLHIATSIVGTIGGLFVFGITGLVLGPLILAYALIVIEFYRKNELTEVFKK